MKSYQRLVFLMAVAATLKAQTNSFPLSGNAGIGTTTPFASAPLHVYAPANASRVVRVENTDGGNGAQVGLHLVNDTTLAAFFVLSGTGYNGVSGWSNKLLVGTDSGIAGGMLMRPAAGGFQVTADGSLNSPNLFVSPSGNVGIGTSNPAYLLDLRVPYSGALGLRINADNAGGAANLFMETSGAAGGSARNWLVTTNYDVAGDFTIRSSNGEGGNPFGATGVTRLTIDRTGNTGIGTTTPQAKLHVSSAGDGAQAIFNAPWTANDQQLLFKTGWSSNDATSGFAALGWKDTTGAGGAFWISTLERGSVATTAPTKRLYIDDLGNIGIGTTTPSASHKFSVNGSVRAKEVVVDTGWADYVFADDYRLAPLREVERHIQEKKHLPGIPSAKEVAEQGVSVGEMQAKLLAKIEELTLHVIRQEKEIGAMRAELKRVSSAATK